MPNRANYAAVDLGSNSFHLLIARLEHGELRVLDRVKEMVRLAEGVDRRGRLDPEVSERALTCLARFRQLLQRVPPGHSRAVATQSFRKLRHPGRFIQAVEDALGCEVEIIGGREEARLVYQGVNAYRPPSTENTLVIDIGGGSTELVIGQGEQIRHAESLQYGCVVVTRDFFSDGRLTDKRWQKAITSARGDLLETAHTFMQTGYSIAIGASGTIRAVLSICQQMQWCEQTITRSAINQLIAHMTATGRIEALKLPGLSERRRPVIAGGVAILAALFTALDIQELSVSPAALREGLLDDLLGRMHDRDPRRVTINAFALRYQVDVQQAGRVMQTCKELIATAQPHWQLNQTQKSLLLWSANIHEAGLAIAHSQYQQHSGYLAAASDLPGFSQLEQRFMAVLVRHHRRNIPEQWHDGLPERLHPACAWCLALLRLAIILHRDRGVQFNHPNITSHSATELCVHIDSEWADSHPLSMQDLQLEQAAWERLQLRLKLAP